MLENIYNLFMFYTDNTCYEFSSVSHRLIGTDNKKIKYLKDNLDTDFKKCKRYQLSSPITKEQENAANRFNKRSRAVLEIYKKFGINEHALVIITPVLNDKIYFECSLNFGGNMLEEIKAQKNIKGKQIDWLTHYTKNNQIDIPQLINDDYFAAIKLTFQNGMYLSSMKLLMSCIDSIGYVEYGSHISFKQWLNEYAKLEQIGITAEELWELRNGILHMSNLESSKVGSGKVRRISFFVTDNKPSFFAESENVYYFNFKELINVYSAALEIWINSYNLHPEKFLTFIERYDKTISDNRLFYLDKSEA